MGDKRFCMMLDTDPVSFLLDYENRSLEEILGAEGLQAFRSSLPAFPEDLLARGILQRAGRAGFYYWLKKMGVDLQWEDPVFKFSPTKKKITRGLQDICDSMSTEKDIALQLENQPDHWVIRVLPGLPTDRKFFTTGCDYLAGFLQEFTSWAGLGKFYQVRIRKEQHDDRASCFIQIDKKPIDS